MMKNLKKSMLFHSPSPACQVMENALSEPVWGRAEAALPGSQVDGLGGPRLESGFRTLKTTVWHRLGAALAGSRSYFGAPVPSKKLDFWCPGIHFCSIWSVRGRAGQVHFHVVTHTRTDGHTYAYIMLDR